MIEEKDGRKEGRKEEGKEPGCRRKNTKPHKDVGKAMWCSDPFGKPVLSSAGQNTPTTAYEHSWKAKKTKNTHKKRAVQLGVFRYNGSNVWTKDSLVFQIS